MFYTFEKIKSQAASPHKFKTIFKRIGNSRSKYLLFPIIIILLLYFFTPLPDPLIKPDYSTVYLDQNGDILRVFLNSGEQWCFPATRNFSEKLKSSVIEYEDRKFYLHPGINPVAIFRAISQNILHGEVVSGASTITMQVARLIRPKKRTYLNKIFEILQAVKIELRYSKDEILGFYLNHAPYGGNIVGIQAAALRYFGKSVEQLTWTEAATLAVLPNAPGLISPTANPNLLKQKRDRLLGKLLQRGVIDSETYRHSLLEPLPAREILFPFHAPHLTRSLRNNYQKMKPVVQTTINKGLQIKVEELLREQVRYLSRYGIRNGAAIVVETKSGKVRVYVGSQNFFDAANQGQVDGVLALRSSGSLLKPFLYSLCMDEGILLPETQIKDIPSFYGTFSPSNANMSYHGMVTAKDALVNSLNVPAVRLLFTHGQPQFYEFLKAAGIKSLFRSTEDYGLPLILGGAEVSLWDMAMMYRGLANTGHFDPLLITATDEQIFSENSSSSLISLGACNLTLNMLRELKRPGSEYYWEQYLNQWPIAWKTGTSYGFRDAWAAGVSPQWTIAVWIGNFNGEGNPALSGASCAGPLLFDIFNSLPKNPDEDWFRELDADMHTVRICAATGFLAGPHCDETKETKSPVYAKTLQICPYHKGIFVDQNATHQVCSLCWEPQDYKQLNVIVYPAEVVHYLREHGHPQSSLPLHRNECPAQIDFQPLKIIYPQQNAHLWIPREVDGTHQRVTARAALRSENRKLFWYLDNRFEGITSDIHTKAIQLSSGWHNLEVIDELGNRDTKRFYASRND
jgi:penicillin-binding protein 1C